MILLVVAVSIPIAAYWGDERSVSTDPVPWDVRLSEMDPYETTLNAWTSGNSLIVMRDAHITSYSRTNGDTQWKVTPPSPQGQFCGYGTTIVDNQLALAYSKQPNSGRPACQFASVLNTRSGSLSWEHEIGMPNEIQPDVAPESGLLEILGDVVVIAQEEGLVGLDLETGQERWKESMAYVAGSASPCNIDDMAPQQQEVYVSFTCNRSGDSGFKIVGVDPPTGQIIKRRDYRQSDLQITPLNARFVSVSPPIVAVQGDASTTQGGFLIMNADDEFSKVSAFDDGPDETAAEIPRDAQNFGTPNTGTSAGTAHQYGRYLITDELFITVTRPSDGVTNDLVAYDLETGQQRWISSVPDITVATPVALDGDSIIAVGTPTDGTGDTSVIRFNTTSGIITQTDSYSIEATPDSDTAPIGNRFRYFWSDGRIYAVQGGRNAGDASETIGIFTLGP